MKKQILYLMIIFLLIPFYLLAEELNVKLSGKILLQVENNGEAWYVYPGDQKGYYLGRPDDAFDVMRELGLGIKHSELENYRNSIFPERLSGRILIDVELNGEAYYVNPNNLKSYYLGRPNDAFNIMRNLGLGITNNNLIKISIGKDNENKTSEEEIKKDNLIVNKKPSVELFVMSHCPFGMQIEKGIIPVLDLLGDKIDFELKFVDYAMHGEKEIYEQLNQYCFQKNEPNKFMTYLNCFLDDGDGEGCILKSNIDKEKLKECQSTTDTQFSITENYENQSLWLNGNYPRFKVNQEEARRYNVQGSPTLIVNGEKVENGRSPLALLTAICEYFIDKPSECSVDLPYETPSSGFGFSVTGSGGAGSCN